MLIASWVLTVKMVLKILFHLFAAIQFFFGCYYDYMYVQIPSTATSGNPFGGKFKYLTFLNAMIQTLYFIIALANDYLGNNEPSRTEKPLIRKLKDILYCSLAFPLAMFVGITFWGIYAVDRELILPRSVDPYFPTWLNHVMHSNIVLFTLIELVSSFRMYPKKRVGLSILCSFMICYVIWVHVIYYNTGTWVYPILKVMNWPLRIVFYVFNLMLVFIMYSFGDLLNSSVWSKEVEQFVKSGKKKVQ